MLRRSVCSQDEDDSRINFEHKVLLLLEVRDGVENIAHGEDGATVRPSVLHMRRALLWVVEQHTTWKWCETINVTRQSFATKMMGFCFFFCSVHLIIYQFSRHVQRYRGLSSSLYCLGPTEKWQWETLGSCKRFNRVFLYSCLKNEMVLPWREHTGGPPSLDSLVLHFCSVSPWTSHCKKEASSQIQAICRSRYPGQKVACLTSVHVGALHCRTLQGCACTEIPPRTWSVWPRECRTEKRRHLHPRWCCCKWSSSGWWRGGATRGHGSHHHGAVSCCHPGNREESDR